MAQFRRESARQEAEEKAISAEKQARDEERQAEEKERQRQREQRAPDEPCALNSRKKADLQDIAYALGLNIEGMVEDLKSRINAYFDEHEPLRTAPRYIGLFPQLERQGNHRPKFLIAV